MAKKSLPPALRHLPPFDREAVYLVRKPITVNAVELEQGDRVPKHLFTSRRLRALYEQRVIVMLNPPPPVRGWDALRRERRIGVKGQAAVPVPASPPPVNPPAPPAPPAGTQSPPPPAPEKDKAEERPKVRYRPNKPLPPGAKMQAKKTGKGKRSAARKS